MTGAFGVVYGVARIVCEFFRDPDPNLEGLGHGLTMGMVLSAPMIVIGLAVDCLELARASRARA